MTNDEYIRFLEKEGEDYVWQFTKQEVDFDKIFLAAKLFNEWKKTAQDVTPEDFFRNQHEKYGITDRHRTLIIAQLFGLLTKNSRTYTTENLTQAFNKINECTTPVQYKTLETEQLLKVKLPALTYSRVTESKISQRHIFPIIFIYQVLRRLKQFQIFNLSLKELFSYVMTANFHTDLDRVITLLTQPIKPVISDSLYSIYKDRSRIIPLIKNLNLFNIEHDSISLNPLYESKMDTFLNLNLSKFLNIDMTDMEKYKKFLYEVQNFDLNLIDDNVEVIISDTSKDILDDDEYTENVATASEIATTQLPDTAKNKPELISSGERVIIKRDAMIGVIAISNSNYLCENDPSHATFISKRTHKQYMEAHHLIPISQAQYIWNKKHVNVDCIENIVSLCPMCHRAIHHGELDVKLTILKNLYDKKVKDLKKVGLDIDFETLLKFYL